MIGLVLAVALVGELTMRVISPFLSGDVRHVESIPQIARALADRPGLRVLFLGNSLTDRAVDPAQFATAISQLCPASIARVVPDASSVAEWDYAFRRYVLREGLGVDVLVIGFGEDQIQDRPNTRVKQLARYYTEWGDLLALFREDITDFESRVDYLLARISVAYAESNRLRLRVLAAAVPKYRENAQRLNRSGETQSVGGRVLEAPRFHSLQRLMQSARAAGALPVVVAIPLPQRYQIAQGSIGAVKEQQGVFVDARTVPGIDQSQFPDRYHMSPAAASVFSAFVAKELVRESSLVRAARMRCGSGVIAGR